MAPDYDLVIIGTGAAGTSAAVSAKRLGASRVALVERGPLWGTCVNTGCIPSKFLLSRAGSHADAGSGGTAARIVNEQELRRMLDAKDALLSSLRKKKQDRVFGELGVELIEGGARFLSPRELQVGERTISARRFIIATGSSPVVPDIGGIRSVPFMTSSEALSPELIPPSLIVVGGRALGLEFAQLYARLGAEVTVLQRSNRILPEEEPAIADMLAGYLKEEGIRILTGTGIVRADRDGDAVTVTVRQDGAERSITADRLLLATGRSPNSAPLDPGKAGVRTRENGAVIVDATLRTSAPGIWAAGDVTGEPMLETAARYGGEIAAWNALRDLKRSFEPAFLPHGIFTTPQVAGVGMTEEQARRAGLHPVCHSITMDRIARSSVDGDTRGMVKIVADREGGRIAGVHICAPLATEMIQEGVAAVRMLLTAGDLAEMPHIFPTASEALAACARGLRGLDTGECLL